jgi:hypothetical protein
MKEDPLQASHVAKTGAKKPSTFVGDMVLLQPDLFQRRVGAKGIHQILQPIVIETVFRQIENFERVIHLKGWYHP